MTSAQSYMEMVSSIVGMRCLLECLRTYLFSPQACVVKVAFLYGRLNDLP